MENDREDAPQLAPASEELSGDVLTDTKRDEVVVTGNEARREPVVFLDHTGARYLFPFERCQTWSDFKFLIREAYSQASEETRSEISKEEFDILTSGNETILPAVWEYVIGGLPLYKRGDYSYTVKIRFWVSNDIYDRPREGSSRHVNPVTARYRRHEGIRRVGSDVSYRNVTIDLDKDARRVRYVPSDGDEPREARRPSSRDSRARSRSHSPASEHMLEDDDQADIENSEEDSVTLTEDEDLLEPSIVLPPPRAVITPMDGEGNSLSFLVDNKWPLRPHESSSTNHNTGSKGEVTSKPRDIRSMEAENLKILKAISTSSESRTIIELHAFSGPEGSSISEDIDVRWYHLHGDQLDFAQFKDACLSVQGLSERLRRLIIKTLAKVEREKLKPFQDGLFIEPGTVLRGDEKHPTDAASVIFSCIPYLDLNPPFKSGSRKSDRLHPPRSLMQSYYPYEPVRERDGEQAFTKFSKGSSNKIIQVPSLWMMNIGAHAIVTCGYRSLSDDLVKSITVIQEDLKALKLKDGNTLLNVRLTDWEGRVLLYSPAECRSYFEMEQKLRELKLSASSQLATASLQLAWNTHEGKKKITPANWLSIFKIQTNIFVNMSIVNEKEAQELDENLDGAKAQQVLTTNSSLKSVPPFFFWPIPTKASTKYGDAAMMGAAKPNSTLNTVQGTPEQDSSVSPEVRRCLNCLEHVEKAMLTETIYEYDARHVVDKTFTSTKYYQSLPEETYEGVQSYFKLLRQSTASNGGGSSRQAMHQIITDMQSAQITTKTSDLVDTVHATLRLFVSDVDKGTILRKVWGAMKSMGTIVGQVDKRCAQKIDWNESTDPEKESSRTGNRQWTIRPAITVTSLGSVPDSDPIIDPEFIKSIKGCKLCRRGKAYTTHRDALEHLEAHAKRDNVKPPDLKDWIRNHHEKMIEEINEGYLLIINQVSKAVQSLFLETQQLAQGVQVEEGQLSELYTIPYELLKTLRILVVFYLAIERAFHHTEISFEKGDDVVEDEDAPFSNMGLEVLNRFCESVKTSLTFARKELCVMASSTAPEDFFRRFSLGPEYLCSWFIRRLLVKPLNDSMTAADIYREYLSTLQFQVNHRPGKRLLRSINLLQEELAALQQVNVWQTKLIDSYIRVLDDKTYLIDIPSRQASFQYERYLLNFCIDNLGDTRDDYQELIRRCGPLSESTKQSAEINEEDHGKAIFVFTVVTVIFMPLSFVTSYLGMNTSDIRDMENKQTLFWIIALPLTAVTMGSIIYMAYYNDEIRDSSSSLYKRLTGREDTSKTASGISVAQRKHALKTPMDSSSTVDYKSLADEAEFAPPRHFPCSQRFDYTTHAEYLDTSGPALATIAYNDYAQPDTKIIPQSHMGRMTKMAPKVTTYRMPEHYPSAEYERTRSYARHQLPPRPPPPPPPPRPGVTDSRPTYMRVARKYVDVDTLLTFGIPWEIDSTDPAYFILLKWMDESETDMLIEHTRKLRMRRKGHDDSKEFMPYNMTDEWYDYEDGKEKPKKYEWVRKSTKTHTRGTDKGYERSGGTRIHIE